MRRRSSRNKNCRNVWTSQCLWVVLCSVSYNFMNMNCEYECTRSSMRTMFQSNLSVGTEKKKSVCACETAMEMDRRRVCKEEGRNKRASERKWAKAHPRTRLHNIDYVLCYAALWACVCVCVWSYSIDRGKETWQLAWFFVHSLHRYVCVCL